MKPFNKEEYSMMCAEFLGFEISENKECFKIPNIYGWNNLSIFYSDWNWIMEVVEKIKNRDTTITVPMNNIQDSVVPYINAVRPITYALINTNKEEVVQAIWEFLNWYNKQQLKKDETI